MNYCVERQSQVSIMKIRPNRKIEREAVNATKAFFESCDCVCQEVDLGKDLYVDITDSGKLTGLCVALQVKGGVSYRRRMGTQFLLIHSM